MTSTAPIPIQNPWLLPVAATHEPPLSERIIRALEAHAAAEAHDLGECERLAESAANPSAQVLLGLIADDARRHQALLRQLIKRLEGEVDFTPLSGAGSTDIEMDPGVAATLRDLIRDEQQGARYLRHLAHQQPDLYDGLYTVLLETIARDAEKHGHILRYLLRRVEAQ